MAMVDLEDDSIRRFIALHHRYDPQRRQWRDVALVAFDDEREFQEFLDARNTELQLRQAAGEADPREDVSGVVRALEHGVWPRGWNPHDPPDGVSVVTAGDPDQAACARTNVRT